MDPAEQRANAVAMLRRAASLPRMKDGRRPPMHGEAGGVSEGERTHSEEKKDLVAPGDVKKDEENDTQVVKPATPTPPPPSRPEVERESEPTQPTEDKDQDDGTEATETVQDISEPERPTSTTETLGNAC